MRKAARPPKGMIITGTDTGVGKTYIACAIATALRAQGATVGVMKPAETGCRIGKGGLVPTDTLSLMHAAGVPDAVDLVNPYRFRLPLAPAVAARIEKKRIRFEKIRSSFHSLVARYERVLVEGAGGILVPLTAKTSYLDLAVRLGLTALIVARPGLGTINHTLLTVNTLRTHGVRIAGIVLNHTGPARRGVAERTNPAVLRELSGVPVIVLPFRSRATGALMDLISPCR